MAVGDGWQRYIVTIRNGVPEVVSFDEYVPPQGQALGAGDVIVTDWDDRDGTPRRVRTRIMSRNAVAPAALPDAPPCRDDRS